MFSASHVRNTIAAAAVTVMLVTAQPHCAETGELQDGTFGCVKCDEGYSIDLNNECSILPEHCIQSDDNGKCLHCVGGYQVDKEKGECFTCEKDCFCTAAEKDKCTGCKLGYGLMINGNACELCKISNCLYCGTDSENCEDCVDGFTLIGKECKSCSDGCATCESANKCNTCINGRYLKDDKCENCSIKNCDACEEVKGVVTCTKCTGVLTYDKKTNKCKAGNGALLSSSSVLSLIAAVSAAVITMAL